MRRGNETGRERGWGARTRMGLAVLVVAACGEEPVGGELYVHLSGHDGAIVVPCDCTSGEPLEFFGVDLWDEQGWTIRFLHDPVDGPAFMVTPPPGGPPVVFVPEDCSRFRGELRKRKSGDDDEDTLDAMYGHLRLSCERLDGASVEGTIRFDRCTD